MSECTYVVASDRPWNRGLAERLSTRCPGRFVLVKSKEDLTVDKLDRLQPRYIFFPHWSAKIPPAVYERYESIIFHMTDVPFGRGGSPLQNLIVRGFTHTLMSALRCEAEMDGGAVYLKKDLCLHGAAEEVFIRASRVIEELIFEIITKNPEPWPQEGIPTVFHRRRPEEGNVAELENLDQFFDHIRMLDAEGYPPAFMEVGPFKLEFSRAKRESSGIVADVKITMPQENGNDE